MKILERELATSTIKWMNVCARDIDGVMSFSGDERATPVVVSNHSRDVMVSSSMVTDTDTDTDDNDNANADADVDADADADADADDEADADADDDADADADGDADDEDGVTSLL